jgi:hypothetical protein
MSCFSISDCALNGPCLSMSADTMTNATIAASKLTMRSVTTRVGPQSQRAPSTAVRCRNCTGCDVGRVAPDIRLRTLTTREDCAARRKEHPVQRGSVLREK